MEFIKKSLRFIIIIGLLSAAAYFGYQTFLKTEPASDLVTVAAPSAAQIKAGRDFLVTLNNLKAIQLNPAIFSERTFAALKDISVTLPEEPKGRPNPFSPIGNDAQVIESESPTPSSGAAQ